MFDFLKLLFEINTLQVQTFDLTDRTSDSKSFDSSHFAQPLYIV